MKSPKWPEAMTRRLQRKPTNPIIRSRSERGIAFRIRKAESLDLRTATNDEINIAFEAIHPGYTCLRFPLPAIGFSKLYRAVRSDSRPIETVANIRYPPPKFVTRYGRANGPGVPIFYAASQPPTALQEMRPEIGEKLVLSSWVLSGKELPQLREVGLLETLDRVKPDLAANLRQLLEPSEKLGLTKQDLRKQKLIRRFLARQFTRIVEPGDEHEYRLSERIAQNLMSGESDGIVYASIATRRSGVNIALRAESLDRLYRPSACIEVEIAKRLGEWGYMTKKIRGTRKISPNGEIIW